MFLSPTYRSFAKVNLHLEVLGRRADGYHELRTLFQSVDLCDLLSVERSAAGVTLEVPSGGAPEGEENLAHRAATAFLERWAPGDGVEISLEKRIPAGGGLGGGSSNAATVLLAMQELFGSPAPPEELAAVARRLGADVPYFLVGGTALGLGRGDLIEEVPDLPEVELCLALPGVAISTAEVFAAGGWLTVPEAPPSMTKPVAGGAAWRDVAAWRNDLEEVVLRRYPAVRAVYNRLLEAGASWVRLSGSGSTLFAWIGEPETRAELSERPPAESQVVLARTLTRKSCDSLRVIQ